MIALESYIWYRAADIKNRAVRGSAYTSTIDCLENKANLVVVSLCKANCIPARVPFQIILRGRMNLWSDNITDISPSRQSCFNACRDWKQHIICEEKNNEGNTRTEVHKVAWYWSVTAELAGYPTRHLISSERDGILSAKCTQRTSNLFCSFYYPG